MDEIIRSCSSLFLFMTINKQIKLGKIKHENLIDQPKPKQPTNQKTMITSYRNWEIKVIAILLFTTKLAAYDEENKGVLTTPLYLLI